MSENESPLPTENTPALAPEPVSTSKKRLRIDRTLIGVNVFIQLLFIFGIIVFVNVVSYRQFKRWDLSHNQNYALSTKTKNLLSHLDQPVRAIVFFPQAQILSKDVSGLLREYEFASARKFSVEYVDPYKNAVRARELLEKYKFGTSDNIVILDYKGKTKFVNAADMAELDNSQAMFGQPPTMRAFKGEEAITSALQEITDDKQNKLYVLTGHGEPPLEGEQVASFKTYVQRENIKLEPLNLNNIDTVPADATGLMVFGPKNDLSEREVQMINDFWSQKKGRLFILLNPAGKTQRLNEWLAAQGIAPQMDRVLKTGTVLVRGEDGQPTMKSGILASPTAVYMPEGKAVTKDVAGNDTQLLGATESLLLDRTREKTEKLKMIPLLQSGEGFWGETEFVQGENRNVFFDPKKDHIGPLTIGVAVEKGGLEDPRVKVDTTRMIVIGNSGFLTDDGLRVSDLGIDFALTSLNWMFNREQVSGIQPKPKKALTLSLDDRMISNIFYVTVLAIPLAAGLLGLFVSWHRRGQNLLALALWVLGAACLITGALWLFNLWVISRESGATTVTARSFAIPIALLLVPIAGIALRMVKGDGMAPAR